MFVSIDYILKQLNDDLGSERVIDVPDVKQWFINLRNSQTDKTLPCVLIDNNEKAVVLYCNDALFEVVKKYQNTSLENISFMDAMKIYKEVKNLMEKK